MKLFDHIFNGVAYKVVADDRMLALTLTDVRNSIVLWNKLNTKLGITLAVHEAMHAEFPALPEHVVEIAGRDIGEYLWRLGYRNSKGAK